MIAVDFQLQHAVCLALLYVCPIVSLAIVELLVIPNRVKTKNTKEVRNGKY